MAESEEETEPIRPKTPEPPVDRSKLVIRVSRAAVHVLSQNPVKQIQNVAKNTYAGNRKYKISPLLETSKNDEAEYVVVENHPNHSKIPPNTMTEEENSSPSGESESGPSSTKRMRINIEPTTESISESNQLQEDQEEIVIQPQVPVQVDLKQIPAPHCAEGIVSSSEAVDSNNEETYFAMSLVGILKRLPPHKRAIAKCHILSYLTELEYGSSSLS